MPGESSTSPTTRKLPFKLRFKQERKEVDTRPSEQQLEEKEASQAGNDQSLTPYSNGASIKASKIAGIAAKRGPRIGPQYQADIPDQQE